MDILSLIGRDQELFIKDVDIHENELNNIIKKSAFHVVGGAGSVGQAVVKEIFKRKPRKLHIVDINENNLVELVRDIRSSIGYIEGEFKTFVVDCGSLEYDVLFQNEGPYDYVLNLSALKHVRSEKDPYTLMRMIDVNIFNTDKIAHKASLSGVKKYFCVSTDKAANPVNMMGASKRIMEYYLIRRSFEIDVSSSRFANVAFSNGSLLHSFKNRIQKQQPIVAPIDVKRYFITSEESGQLCLMACILGENRDIFFPKLINKLHLITFTEIAIKYLSFLGYEAVIFDTEEEARAKVNELLKQNKWPCYFFVSDTTGEKSFEEFYTEKETIEMERFNSIGINSLKLKKKWTRKELIDLFISILPEFKHKETGKFLDERM